MKIILLSMNGVGMIKFHYLCTVYTFRKDTPNNVLRQENNGGIGFAQPEPQL